jgi:hypothetical protein
VYPLCSHMLPLHPEGRQGCNASWWKYVGVLYSVGCAVDCVRRIVRLYRGDLLSQFAASKVEGGLELTIKVGVVHCLPGFLCAKRLPDACMACRGVCDWFGLICLCWLILAGLYQGWVLVFQFTLVATCSSRSVFTTEQAVCCQVHDRRVA